MGHSSSMCLTDKIFLQTHVIFCEYLVFHEFKRNLYITLAKYLEQEGIANLLFKNLAKMFVDSLFFFSNQYNQYQIWHLCVPTVAFEVM